MKTGQTNVARLFGRAKVLATLVLASLVLWPALPAAAEGSRTLYPTTQPADAARANLEWNDSSVEYGPDALNLYRRTLLKVYAEAGEYILMGSSAVDVPDLTGANDKGDVLIYKEFANSKFGPAVLPDKLSPDRLFSCKEQRDVTKNTAQGRISSRTQETAGPNTIANPVTAAPGNAVPGGYVPCFFQAPAAGIYEVVFLGPEGATQNKGFKPTNPSGQIDTAANYDSRQSTSVAAWDVTVRASLTDTTDITGRLFSYYLSMFTGGNDRPIYSKIYMVTLDGFRYEVDLNAMDPNGFIIYGNQKGFLDTDGTPLYHDVLAVPTLSFDEQNRLTQLQGNVTLAPPEYPIFFNPPDEKVLIALGIPLTTRIPEVTNFLFSGADGGITTEVGKGGTFSFNSNVSGLFEIVVSRDGVDFASDNPLNRVLTGEVDGNGQASVIWDGFDSSNEPFPQQAGPYFAQTIVHGGELHFPFLDVENSTEGSPMIKMLNPPELVPGQPNLDCAPIVSGCTGAFYDDRGYVTANGELVGVAVNGSLCVDEKGNSDPGHPPEPISAIDGYDTTQVPNDRAFGFGTSAFPFPSSGSRGNSKVSVCAADAGFGDKKGLDLWTYYPSNEYKTPLRIISSANTAINLVSFSAYAQQNAITVQWQTSAEVNTFGFHLFRSSDGTRANAVQVTPQLIAAKGRGQGGATYTWTDPTAKQGQRYSYWLQEVETNGATDEHGPATAVFGGPTSGSVIYLPMIR